MRSYGNKEGITQNNNLCSGASYTSYFSRFILNKRSI